MQKVFSGAVMGVVIGGLALLLIDWFNGMIDRSVETGGHGTGVILGGMVGFAVLGAILGSFLPWQRKEKTEKPSEPSLPQNPQHPS